MGSAALGTAISKFVNKYFSPTISVDPSQIIITNGVTALLDMLAFSICDAGEGIMYTTPTYGMFSHDLQARNEIKIVEIPTEDTFDQFSAASADELIERVHTALKTAIGEGIVVKAVLICNPSNPLGRCYSRSTLIRLAQFCAVNELHLISDEIYAMSVFSGADDGNTFAEEEVMDGFTSALSIDNETGVDGRNIHVLYGAAKDFGLGGLHLGMLFTKNMVLWEACRRLA